MCCEGFDRLRPTSPTAPTAPSTCKLHFTQEKPNWFSLPVCLWVMLVCSRIFFSNWIFRRLSLYICYKSHRESNSSKRARNWRGGCAAPSFACILNAPEKTGAHSARARSLPKLTRIHIVGKRMRSIAPVFNDAETTIRLLQIIHILWVIYWGKKDWMPNGRGTLDQVSSVFLQFRQMIPWRIAPVSCTVWLWSSPSFLDMMYEW